MSYLKKYLAELVYGGIDGTVTTFAVIAGAIGASLSPSVVLILGFANLFADGFSMAASNYLSTKSYNEVGGGRSAKAPIKTALATFISFIVIGFIPLFSFVIAPLSSFFDEQKFAFSIVFTGLSFLGIGWAKGEIVGKKRLHGAIETFLVGSLAALIAFLIGYYLKDIV